MLGLPDTLGEAVTDRETRGDCDTCGEREPLLVGDILDEVVAVLSRTVMLGELVKELLAAPVRVAEGLGEEVGYPLEGEACALADVMRVNVCAALGLAFAEADAEGQVEAEGDAAALGVPQRLAVEDGEKRGLCVCVAELQREEEIDTVVEEETVRERAAGEDVGERVRVGEGELDEQALDVPPSAAGLVVEDSVLVGDLLERVESVLDWLRVRVVERVREALGVALLEMEGVRAALEEEDVLGDFEALRVAEGVRTDTVGLLEMVTEGDLVLEAVRESVEDTDGEPLGLGERVGLPVKVGPRCMGVPVASKRRDGEPEGDSVACVALARALPVEEGVRRGERVPAEGVASVEGLGVREDSGVPDAASPVGLGVPLLDTEADGDLELEGEAVGDTVCVPWAALAEVQAVEEGVRDPDLVALGHPEPVRLHDGDRVGGRVPVAQALAVPGARLAALAVTLPLGGAMEGLEECVEAFLPSEEALSAALRVKVEAGEALTVPARPAPPLVPLNEAEGDSERDWEPMGEALPRADSETLGESERAALELRVPPFAKEALVEGLVERELTGVEEAVKRGEADALAVLVRLWEGFGEGELEGDLEEDLVAELDLHVLGDMEGEAESEGAPEKLTVRLVVLVALGDAEPRPPGEVEAERTWVEAPEAVAVPREEAEEEGERLLEALLLLEVKAEGEAPGERECEGLEKMLGDPPPGREGEGGGRVDVGLTSAVTLGLG